MEINKDFAKPSQDLYISDEGKYLYKLDKDTLGTNRLYYDVFDRDYEQYIKIRNEEMQRQLNDKLAELNRPFPELPVYDRPMSQIMIDTKDQLFGLLDDLLQFDFSFNIFTKNDRLFYLGLFLLFIGIILFAFYSLLN